VNLWQFLDRNIAPLCFLLCCLMAFAVIAVAAVCGSCP
jgi:hypothetical protein